ncbi:hypothetical protein BG003_010343 [Podila horticola]|nr:hypothetical protein BG003_010343 [Podila horticola]
MGRPTGRNLEDELMTKIKLMFDRFYESDQKDNWFVIEITLVQPNPFGAKCWTETLQKYAQREHDIKSSLERSGIIWSD